MSACILHCELPRQPLVSSLTDCIAALLNALRACEVSALTDAGADRLHARSLSPPDSPSRVSLLPMIMGDCDFSDFGEERDKGAAAASYQWALEELPAQAITASVAPDQHAPAREQSPNPTVPPCNVSQGQATQLRSRSSSFEDDKARPVAASNKHPEAQPITVSPHQSATRKEHSTHKPSQLPSEPSQTFFQRAGSLPLALPASEKSDQSARRVAADRKFEETHGPLIEEELSEGVSAMHAFTTAASGSGNKEAGTSPYPVPADSVLVDGHVSARLATQIAHAIHASRASHSRARSRGRPSALGEAGAFDSEDETADQRWGEHWRETPSAVSAIPTDSTGRATQGTSRVASDQSEVTPAVLPPSPSAAQPSKVRV
jgi:hypothetical protein